MGIWGAQSQSPSPEALGSCGRQLSSSRSPSSSSWSLQMAEFLSPEPPQSLTLPARAAPGWVERRLARPSQLGAGDTPTLQVL